ncbi:MAG: hypothetical protein E3J60_03465 [Dehalococcoidia bacterium]|nr:MAG: hypothetical protein E3J60_03465 [Dehalococcoidia bacterium]
MAWELVTHTKTLAGWFFIGQAEEATFDVTLPPEELPGISWFADQVTAALVEGAKGEGQVLETIVYFDTASWWNCKYRVIATGHGSPIAWATVIAIALVVIGIAIIAWMLHSVESKPWLGIGLVGLGVGAAALGIAALVKSTKKEGI